MEPATSRPPRTAEPSSALRQALSGLLPGAEERWLLQALLGKGERGREAWDRFRCAVPDLPALFRTDTGGRKRLGPLLLTALRRLGVEGDGALMTVLRTGYLREELRADAYGSVVREVVSALDRSGVPTLLLKGAALAEAVYPERCLRHAHDIDLLVSGSDLEPAARALAEAGLTPGPFRLGDRGRTLRHRTEVPVLLADSLYRTSFYRSGFATLRARRRTLSLGGLVVSTLSPADHLLHALGHASLCPSRSSLLWVVDAWMLLAMEPPPDWVVFVEETRRSRLDLPVFLMTEFLIDDLGAPIPDEVRFELQARAARADPLRRDVALYGARQTRGKHPWLESTGRGGWRDRMSALRWRLFPSPAYIRWAFRPRHRALVPLYYLTRPFTWAVETLKWRVRGWWGGWTG